MKTKILLILLTMASFSISCNKDEEDNCQEKINKINEYYAQQIILADGNETKISLLLSEKEVRLRNACK